MPRIRVNTPNTQNPKLSKCHFIKPPTVIGRLPDFSQSIGQYGILNFNCPDEERFYMFEIIFAFRTIILQLFRVVVFAFNKPYFSRLLQSIARRSKPRLTEWYSLSYLLFH